MIQAYRLDYVGLKVCVALPQFIELLNRAVIEALPEVDPGSIWKLLVDNYDNPSMAVFLGIEDNAPKAIGIASLPVTPLMITPQIALLYNEGPPALVAEMAGLFRTWLEDNGYDRFLTMNRWAEDKVFLRAFRRYWDMKTVASVVECRIRAEAKAA